VKKSSLGIAAKKAEGDDADAAKRITARGYEQRRRAYSHHKRLGIYPLESCGIPEMPGWRPIFSHGTKGAARQVGQALNDEATFLLAQMANFAAQAKNRDGFQLPVEQIRRICGGIRRD